MIPFLTCLLKLLLMPRRCLFNGGCRAKEPVGAGVGCFYGRHFLNVIFMDIIFGTSFFGPHFIDITHGGVALSICPGVL